MEKIIGILIHYQNSSITQKSKSKTAAISDFQKSKKKVLKLSLTVVKSL